MFLHVCVILFTGGGVSGEPPRDQGEPPPDQGEPPPGPGRPPRDQADTPPGRRLQHTVNERPVRILLECILVVCSNKNLGPKPHTNAHSDRFRILPSIVLLLPPAMVVTGRYCFHRCFSNHKEVCMPGPMSFPWWVGMPGPRTFPGGGSGIPGPRSLLVGGYA